MRHVEGTLLYESAAFRCSDESPIMARNGHSGTICRMSESDPFRSIPDQQLPAERYGALRSEELLAAGDTDGNRVVIRIGLAVCYLERRSTIRVMSVCDGSLPVPSITTTGWNAFDVYYREDREGRVRPVALAP